MGPNRKEFVAVDFFGDFLILRFLCSLEWWKKDQHDGRGDGPQWSLEFMSFSRST